MKRIILDCRDDIAPQVIEILYQNQAAISSFAIQEIPSNFKDIEPYVKSTGQDV